MIGTIELQGLEFHAYHGVYPHERSSGNKFQVDVSVETEFSASAFQDELSGTINYEDLYAVIKNEMEKPSKLLEKVSYDIADEILKTFPTACRVTVKIAKCNPPIGGVCHKAIISVQKIRS